MKVSDRHSETVIIGMAGRAQHGKTTLSKCLLEHLKEVEGLTVEIMPFAAMPKRMLLTLGLNHDQLFGNSKEKPTTLLGGRTPRFAMQSLATEWGRNLLYNEIWVDAWEREVSDAVVKRRIQVIIVDDLRHIPELIRLREMGAIVCEVYRPGIMPQTLWGWAKHWFKQLTAHSSEQLDFSKCGIERIIVEEGDSDATLKKLLALIARLQ